MRKLKTWEFVLIVVVGVVGLDVVWAAIATLMRIPHLMFLAGCTFIGGYAGSKIYDRISKP